MNMTTNKVFGGLALIIAVVLVVAGAYVYTNYKIVNGKLVNVQEFSYSDIEQAYQNSYDNGDPDAQIEYAEKLKSLGLDNNRSNLYLAEALVNKGSLQFKEDENADKAISVLNDVLIKDPNNAEALSALAYAYEIKGDFNKAFKFYDLAVKADPSNPVTYTRRGHAHDLNGEINLAEDDYIKSYNLDANGDANLMDLARLYYGVGESDRAVDFANKAIAASTNVFVKSTAYDLIGQIEIDNDNYDAALGHFNQAIQINPKFPGAYEHRAYVYLLQTDGTSASTTEMLVKKANPDIEKAQTINPDSSFSFVLRGLVLDLQKQSLDARASYTKALAMVDTDITLGKADKTAMREQIQSLLDQAK